MSLDTGAIKYWTGHPGVVAPNDPIATIESVARAYDVRWLYVERSNAVPALGPILDGSGRPGWVGAAGLERDRDRRDGRCRPLPGLLQHRPIRAASSWPAWAGVSRLVSSRLRPGARHGARPALLFVFALARPGRLRPDGALPHARGHRLLRDGRPQPGRAATA